MSVFRFWVSRVRVQGLELGFRVKIGFRVR